MLLVPTVCKYISWCNETDSFPLLWMYIVTFRPVGRRVTLTVRSLMQL